MFRLTLGRKDIRLAMELGKDYDVPQPVRSAVEQKLIEEEAAGLGDKHVDAVILRLEEPTGLKLRAEGDLK